MGKKKLQHFAEMKTFEHVFEPDKDEMLSGEFRLKGKWRSDFFMNENPLVLELGCGKGEYSIGMAKVYPDRNFVGIDIKGARMWRGAKTADEDEMKNVAFLRTKIEFINTFFGKDEVDEIWLTFSDPQIKDKKASKRLTSPKFIEKYRQLLKPAGIVHLKTDSDFLYQYTLETIERENYQLLYQTPDLYRSDLSSFTDEEKYILNFKTFYELKFLHKGENINYVKYRVH